MSEYEIRSGSLAVRFGFYEPGMWHGRKSLKLTQKGLAGYAGVTASVINRAETGRLLPDQDTRKSIADAVRGTTGIDEDELPNPAIEPLIGYTGRTPLIRAILTRREILRMFPPEGRDAWIDFIPFPDLDSPRVIIQDAAKSLKEKDLAEARILLWIAENRSYNNYTRGDRQEMVEWAKNLSLDLNTDLTDDRKKLKKIGYLRKIFQLREELKEAQAQEPDMDQTFE